MGATWLGERWYVDLDSVILIGVLMFVPAPQSKKRIRYLNVRRVLPSRLPSDINAQYAPGLTCVARVIGESFLASVVFNLTCFDSQVHDIHPSHPFILVPDKPKRSISEPDFMANQSCDPGEEQCKPSLIQFIGSCSFSHVYSHETSGGTMFPVRSFTFL